MPSEHMRVDSTAAQPNPLNQASNAAPPSLKLKIKRSAVIAAKNWPQCAEPGCARLLEPQWKRKRCHSCTQKLTNESRRSSMSTGSSAALPAIALCSSCFISVDTKDLPEGSLQLTLCEACQLKEIAKDIPHKPSAFPGSPPMSAAARSTNSTTVSPTLPPADVAKMAAAYVQSQNLGVLMRGIPEVPQPDSSRDGRIIPMHAHYEQAFGAPPALAHISHRDDRTRVSRIQSAHSSPHFSDGPTVRISAHSVPGGVRRQGFSSNPSMLRRNTLSNIALVPSSPYIVRPPPLEVESTPARICMSSGCDTVLPPDHMWTFCAKCLDIPEDSHTALKHTSHISDGQDLAPSEASTSHATHIPIKQPFVDLPLGETKPSRPSLRIRIGPRRPSQTHGSSGGPSMLYPIPQQSSSTEKANTTDQAAVLSPKAQDSASAPQSSKHALSLSVSAGQSYPRQRATIKNGLDSTHVRSSQTSVDNVRLHSGRKDVTASEVRITPQSDVRAHSPADDAVSARRASGNAHMPARGLAEMLPPLLATEPAHTPFAPRECSTKGCMELVPAESRWSRCTSCGFQKWRKLHDKMRGTRAPTTKTSKGKERAEDPIPVTEEYLSSAASALRNEGSEAVVLDGSTPSAKLSLPLDSSVAEISSDATPHTTSTSVRTNLATGIPETSGGTSEDCDFEMDDNVGHAGNTMISDLNAGLSSDQSVVASQLLDVLRTSHKLTDGSALGANLPNSAISPSLSNNGKQRLNHDKRVPVSPSSPEVTYSSILDDVLPLDYASGSELTPLSGSAGELSSISPESESEEEPLAKVVARKKRPRVRLIVRPPVPVSGATVCRISRCQNLLHPSSRWKLCDFCRTYYRQYQRKRLGIDGGRVYRHKDQEEDLQDATMSPQATERVCSVRGCRRLLPPLNEYRWKMCEPCRTRTRDQAYARSAVLKYPVDHSGLSTADDLDVSARRKRRRLDDSPTYKQQIARDAVALEETTRTKKRKFRNIASDFRFVPKPQFMQAPAFQHQEILLDTLGDRFTSFVVAQTHYLRFKLMHQPSKDGRYPMLFMFDGEYSTVADPAGGPVDPVVRGILLKIQSALGMTFKPTGVSNGPDWAIVSRFSCVHELQIPVPLPAEVAADPSDQPREKPGMMFKRMAGELEVIVAWDRRHSRIPGQRVVIQLRLLG